MRDTSEMWWNTVFLFSICSFVSFLFFSGWKWVFAWLPLSICSTPVMGAILRGNVSLSLPLSLSIPPISKLDERSGIEIGLEQHFLSSYSKMKLFSIDKAWERERENWFENLYIFTLFFAHFIPCVMSFTNEHDRKKGQNLNYNLREYIKRGKM